MSDQNNNKGGEDAESMRLAFETFMLQQGKQKSDNEQIDNIISKSKKKKKKKKQNQQQKKASNVNMNIGSRDSDMYTPPPKPSTKSGNTASPSPSEGGSASAAPTPSASAPVGKPTLCLNGRTPKEMLLSFYQTHNPTKLHDSSIDRVLIKYAGNEEQLFRNLAMKYNLDPNIFFVSSSAVGDGAGGGDGGAAPSKPTTTKSSSSTATTTNTTTPSKAKKSVMVTDTSSTPTFTPGGKEQQSISTTTTPTTTTTTTTITIIAKSDKKRYYQHLRTFTTKIQHTWLVIDNQLLSVVQNIVSIRGRLPLEYKLLQQQQQQQQQQQGGFGDFDEGEEVVGCNPQEDDTNNNHVVVVPQEEDEWKTHGVQGKQPPKSSLPCSSSLHLHSSDVHLALSNDVTQHEKMLVNLRSLMTNLAECNDGLGRALDNLWKFHLDCCMETQQQLLQDDNYDDYEGGANYDDYDDDDDEVISNTRGDNNTGVTGELETMEGLVQSVTHVYQMLSSELYRKQCLIPLVLESTRDDLLGVDDNETQTVDNGGNDSGPVVNGEDGNRLSGLQLARKICKSWQLSSEESCVDEKMISYLLKLGEMPQAK